MHVSAPGRLVVVRLEHVGDELVGVTSPCRLRITLEPVDEPFYYSTVSARLVVGYRLDCAHSVFCTPRGCTVHAMHSLMQGPHHDHPAVVTCQRYLGPCQHGQNLPSCPATAGLLFGC